MEFGGEDEELGTSSSSSSWLMGSRQRFNIELRPGETTIVSWKRLVKDALNNNPSSQPAPKSEDNHFQNEKLTTGHNGCLIDNGSVENVESISSADQKVKKRRKNTSKMIDNGKDNLSNKHVKLDLNSEARISQGLATSSECHRDVKSELPIDSHPPIAFSEKDGADNTGIKLEYSSCLISKDSEKQGTGTITCGRESGNAVNHATELSGATHKNYQEKSACEHLEPQPKRLMEEMGGLEISSNASMREKSGSMELPDLNITAEPIPLQPTKSASMTSKDPSGLRSRGTMLERAIKELEEVIAELRPSNMDLNNLDTSSMAMKKRLPSEVKLKLAKVARLAQSSQGIISEELVNHLMSIVGHLVQLKTLKRNLREMVLRGLSAKREKADRFQQIKKEVAEMIKLQGYMQGSASGIFTEAIGTEKVVMENAMEDKICDLYDLYVQGMDEDKGPQIRKLYVELVELWPNGAMDKHQIKDAIRRAKERKRALYDYQKVCENVRKKKSTPRTDIARGEASSVSLPEAALQRLFSQSNSHKLSSSDKMIPSPPSKHNLLTTAASLPNSLFVGSSINLNEERKLEKTTMPILKEQIKQQQRELETNVKKSSIIHEMESHKRHKPGPAHTDDLSSQLAASGRHE